MKDNKTPAMRSVLDEISVSLFGTKRSESLEENKCVSCSEPIREFKDKLSAKEYSISGLCQNCQDQVFG